MFFPAKKPAPPAEAQTGAPVQATAAKTEPGPAPAAAVAQDHPEVPNLALESNAYRLTLTNKGAGIRDLALKAGPGGKEEVVLLASRAGVAPHLALKADGVADKIET